jgi:predicted SnoaL-like aldol condensation-catalyzing enzyme
MSAQRNTALVRRAVKEILNQGDLDLADLLFAPTYINHGGLIPDLVHGPEAIKIGVCLYRTAFPGLHVTVEALVAEGETVALRWSASSAPPSARPHVAGAVQRETLTGTTFGRLAHGQIAESWTFWDRANVLKRLGVVPAETGTEPGPATRRGSWTGDRVAPTSLMPRRSPGRRSHKKA